MSNIDINQNIDSKTLFLHEMKECMVLIFVSTCVTIPVVLLFGPICGSIVSGTIIGTGIITNPYTIKPKEVPNLK